MEKDEAPASGDAGGARTGELADVGPAGPATASARGVVMVTKSDELVLAKLAKAAFEPVKTGADAFSPYSRGPAIAGDHAYWISKQRLVRRKLDGGPLETLAEDARSGTRVAAAVAKGKAAAAYIGQADDSTIARLWIENVGTWTLTPDGAAASSVALAMSGADLYALSLEGRTGMTPVHARVTDFAGTPKLDDDVVVWVAGPAQPLTEIAAIAAEGAGVWAFVPLERDISRFGLAQLKLADPPTMGAPVTWRAYPNGLDPAAVATANACGGAFVLYAQPAEAKPRAPQELAIARVDATGLGPGRVVARSRAFSNASLAATQGGMLVAYVADKRTWALWVECPH